MIVCFAGDVMTGRGIDQILPYPSSPELYEPWVRDAREYVELAEDANGPIERPVDFAYAWGEALEALEDTAVDARVVNLETSITRDGEPWPEKGIHYRMHPANVPCLTSGRVDVATLANNHVLDWGTTGLDETLEALRTAAIKTTGAGRNWREAREPAIVDAKNGRLVIVGVADESSGVPLEWAATPNRAGVVLLRDCSEREADAIGDWIARIKRPRDVLVLSIHWGSNWGYEISDEQIAFAHALIGRGVDVIHGHSSHHPRPIEVYDRRLVLYGCGDLLNDYEGITGYERFRGDLALLYFATIDDVTGELLALSMQPFRVRNMRLRRASASDADWLAVTLTRVSQSFGSAITTAGDRLVLTMTA